MALDREALKEEFNPIKKTKDYLKYKFDFAKEHPNYFYADGLVVFVGPQGSGKTLTAVNYVYNLMKKYPKALLITNILLKDYPFDNERVFPFHNNDDFSKYNNGEEGVIFFVDEIQLYLNSLESKNINMDVITQISQQRKQRKHIVATSQVFGRLAKPLREQFSTVVSCKKFLGFIQRNQLIDRDSIEDNQDDMHIDGKVLMTTWFVHTPMYYSRYDTYYVISQNKFIAQEEKKGDIYGSELSVNCG